MSSLPTDGPGAAMQHSAASFDALYTASADPWLFKSRWYEARKRALTLACLPAARYGSAFEPGCAIGELSAGLAERCDELLVSDGSARAVAQARERLGGWARVRVLQAWMPADWPDQSFDLIVLSELGYFLSVADLDRLAQRMRASLRPGGTVLACHWRRKSSDCTLDGDQVHARLADGLALPHLSSLLEADLRIDVWCCDARSVAQREGFV